MGQQFQGQTSKTLDATTRQFLQVVWQNGRLPQDSEFNLMSQIADDRLQQHVRAAMPSGWIQDPLAAVRDFGCVVENSNLFHLGQSESPLWANVNGWIIPFTGVNNAGYQNTVQLAAPPTSGSRIDLVWLEVWLANISPNPSTVGKPSASTIWKYGNTQFIGTNPADDLIHPEVGYESTRRVQVQYRLRVQGSGASGVDISTYPEGMNDPNVLAQGNTSAPVAAQTFTNMRTVLGDQGLWRAGPGLVDENSANPLGTLDGYVYAIPIAAVFRRNSDGWSAAGSTNHNGAYSRGSTAQVFGSVSLTNALSYSTSGVVNVTGLEDSGFLNPDLYSGGKVVLAQIGQEIVSISATSAAGVLPQTMTITRGRAGTVASSHAADTPFSFWTHRPDGLFADQVVVDDILDLRHSVRPAWDHQQILQGALWSLLRGQMRSAYKQSYEGGGGQGPTFLEVSTLLADGGTAVSAGTSALDGPDGIRTVWSDAIVTQRDVTIMLDPAVAKNAGYTTTTFDQGVSWQIGATTLKASGFVPHNGADNNSWVDGTVIRLYLGGETGSDGARATFRDGGTRQVRFVSPREQWTSDTDPVNQHPVTFRALNQTAHESPAPSLASTQSPGPAYPMSGTMFESPILFLGGLAHADLRMTIPTANLTVDYELDLGIDFTTWTDLLGGRTLKDLLTGGGLDATGLRSELYVVLTGDDTAAGHYNNGAFRVVGAGDDPNLYTSFVASNATSLFLLPLSPGYSGWDSATAKTLTLECRTQTCSPQDGGNFASGIASSVIVLTDIQGQYNSDRNVSPNGWNPWNSWNLNPGGTNPDVSIPAAISGPAVISLSLMYGPSRGGTLRVPQKIHNVSVTGAAGLYLRRPLTTLDSDINTDTGYPVADIVYPTNPIQTSNLLPLEGDRLGSESNDRVGTEVLRESEVMVDSGSKTLWFNPLQRKAMTLRCHTRLGDLWTGGTYPNADSMDGPGIFTANRTLGCAVPLEVMPRFGRLDIPYYRDIEAVKGTGNFLEGLNHLFVDNLIPSSPVFALVGGTDNNTAGEQVTTMLFQTGSSSGLSYGRYGTLIIGTHDAWQARLCNDQTVQSGDFGKGLRGIELPPALGFARVLGVYERSNFIAKSGSTYQADRVSLTPDPATNLLRSDQDHMTLFIRQDGAQDEMGETGWHTYVLPSHMLDLTKIPTSDPANGGYNPNLTFSDYEYVVEAEIFGFARNWISENNWILVRRHDGAGLEALDANARTLTGVPMVVHAAAPLNEQLLVTSLRVPYQGDPYGSRNGSLKDMRDEPGRYGQIPVASAYGLNTPLNQFDSLGNMQIETPNPRVFEILALADFTTSLGTGKLGGRVWSKTLADPGYLDATGRLPSQATSDPWDLQSSTYTEGQQAWGTHATAELQVLQTLGAVLPGTSITISDSSGLFVTCNARDETTYTGASGEFLVTPPTQLFQGSASLNFPNILAGGTQTLTVPVAGASPLVRATVQVTPMSPVTGLVYDGYVSAANVVTVRATNITGVPIDPAAVTVNVWVTQALPPTSAIGLSQTAADIAQTFNSQNRYKRMCLLAVSKGNVVTFTAREPGSAGNELRLTVSNPGAGSFRVLSRSPNFLLNAFPAEVQFTGGVDKKVSAGNGRSPLSLTGSTNQLPLGILCQDADFQAEQVQGSYLSVTGGKGSAPSSPSVYLDGGDEWSSVSGQVGDLLGMADAANLQYQASGVGAVRKFRNYRGASVWSLSGNPGGPVTWGVETLPKVLEPLVKSGLLVGRAMLVRNAPEDAFATNTRVSEGGEVQMVVLTKGVVGYRDPSRDLVLEGEIGPCGHGEGYASAERYRLSGRPLMVPKDLPNPVVPLAPYDPTGEQ